jgi:hypothetical protein
VWGVRVNEVGIIATTQGAGHGGVLPKMVKVTTRAKAERERDSRNSPRAGGDE